jgi:hypothetical protein
VLPRHISLKDLLSDVANILAAFDTREYITIWLICPYHFAEQGRIYPSDQLGPCGHRRGPSLAKCLQADQPNCYDHQRGALARPPKLLLTATPLQNSLLELYGLVSVIDEYTFSDLKSAFTASNGGEPWKYLLISHNVVMTNMSFVTLAKQYEVK